MSKNITISSFKKLPAGFLIALILFIATESFIYLARADLIEDYWNKFIINEHVLIDGKQDYDYLLIGDSIQKTGIIPEIAGPGLLSLGLPGAKPIGLYVMLERYLKKHKPPKAIFLFVDPEDQHDSLMVVLRYFVTLPEALSIWKDLSRKEREVFLMRYLASLDLRKTGLTVRDKFTGPNKNFAAQLKKNRGFLPPPEYNSALEDGYFAKTKARYQEKISISKTDMKYLDKLMRLASKNNIKIVFIGCIFPRELHDILEKSGFNGEYLSFWEALKQKYPEAVFADRPILFLENNYFGDRTHVNKNGALIYTNYFRDRVFRPFKEGAI